MLCIAADCYTKADPNQNSLGSPLAGSLHWVPFELQASMQRHASSARHAHGKCNVLKGALPTVCDRTRSILHVQQMQGSETGPNDRVLHGEHHSGRLATRSETRLACFSGLLLSVASRSASQSRSQRSARVAMAVSKCKRAAGQASRSASHACADGTQCGLLAAAAHMHKQTSDQRASVYRICWPSH